MRIKIYKRLRYLLVFAAMFLLSIMNTTHAQTTITTEAGTNYTGGNGVSGNAAVTFVVENTNAAAIVLTQVDVFWNTLTVTSPVNATLWYTATSLSGAPTITSPTWTSIATAPVTITTAGYYPTFLGLSFIIPGNTTYRFAVQNTSGITYSGTAGPPSPSTFSSGGVNLGVYNYQITAANVGYGGSFPSPANNPRAFTGRITFTNATPCTGTPAPGNTISNANPACPSVNFNLSLQNSTSGTGVTYQWQSSPNGSTWSNVGGATNSTLSTSQTVATYYRCNVTCSGNTTASNPLLVTMNSVNNCYCNSGATSTADEDIFNVTVGTLNNTSTCASVGPGPGSALNLYSNYTSGSGAPAAPALGQGSSAPFSVEVGTCGGNWSNSVGIFIDFNQNGVFDVPSERVYLSAATTSGPHIESGTIAIPAGATLGLTRMRVISAETAPANIVPCGASSSWGETEDYLVNIVSCVVGAFTTQPSPATISCGLNTSFTVAGNGTAAAFQWQENTGAAWINISNGGIYGGATTTTLTLTAVPPTYTGYQYRCVLTGTCTPATNSNAAILTVTQPPAPSISPAPPVSMCLGTPIALNITTAGGFGAPVTVTFPSTTPLNLAIPENVAGVSHTLAVSGIPIGAVITNVSVTVNIPHTWVSDLMLNLKAPNGSVLNLSNLIGATNRSGANFTNTVFSSTSATTLVSGAAPYTGTFKPDGNVGATGAFGVPGGPTGFLPTVANFAGLISAPNGNWTIAMYDAGPPDVGQLVNWTVSITYTPIVPVQGAWTPVTGLFTNAGGTVAYTGGLASTVFAAPATNTTYSVTYTIGGCNSPATLIPVTVNSPINITAQPVNKSVCTDKSTSIAVTATGTNPLYQWQVSTTGAAGPWTNVANGVNYAGTTTNTLAINNPPTSWNTNQYRVVVTGAAPCGAVNSNPAILTVYALPTVGLTASPYTSLYPGLRTTLSATSNPTGANYVWLLNGGQIASGTASSWIADIDGLGTYRTRVTDINGCVNTSNGVSILDSVSGKVFIYPSPNNGVFQVRYYSVKGNEVPRSLVIYDSKGAKVFTQTYTVGRPYDKMSVNMGTAPTGVYRVELSDRNGKRIATGTVMIVK